MLAFLCETLAVPFSHQNACRASTRLPSPYKYFFASNAFLRSQPRLSRRVKCCELLTDKEKSEKRAHCLKGWSYPKILGRQ